MYKLVLTGQAVKDAQKLEQTEMKKKAMSLLQIIRQNPLQSPPQFEKLHGCTNTFSRRINIQHRLIYQILPNQDNETDAHDVLYQGIIKIIRMWTHYE